MKHKRHGDVDLSPHKGKVTGEKQEHGGSFVLAYGEATGHHHTLTVPSVDDMEIYKCADGGFIVRLKKDGTLTHPEHKPLTIPAGTWRQRIEREKDWFSLSVHRVVD